MISALFSHHQRSFLLQQRRTNTETHSRSECSVIKLGISEAMENLEDCLWSTEVILKILITQQVWTSQKENQPPGLVSILWVTLLSSLPERLGGHWEKAKHRSPLPIHLPSFVEPISLPCNSWRVPPPGKQTLLL